jgi:ABC-2 type transport system ATP-binding protein
MEPIVEAQGLSKRFGAVQALDGLDLTVPGGKVLALLGPNGAGKTTLVRTIATLVRPDSGTLRVAGIDVARHPDRVRRVIGLAGQSAAIEPAMTGRENLRMVARLFGHGRRETRVAADAVLEQLGLEGAGDRLVRTYSGGMRRRLDLGASLVGAPRLLLLDEPTTGLDPRSRSELWAAIEALVEQGTDVLLTTQYLDEADHLADLIAIIDRGRLVAAGPSDELKSRAGRDVIEFRVRDAADLGRIAGRLGGGASVDEGRSRIALPAPGGADDVLDTLRALQDADVAIDDIALRRPTLDDVFLVLTGHTTDAATPEEVPA